MPMASRRKVVEHCHTADAIIAEEPIDKMASDEACTAHDAVARPSSATPDAHPSASHLVLLAASAGWLTRRCQSTAHSPSVWGVTLSGCEGGTMMQAVATLAV